jgi:hypothetical protein
MAKLYFCIFSKLEMKKKLVIASANIGDGFITACLLKMVAPLLLR